MICNFVGCITLSTAETNGTKIWTHIPRYLKFFNNIIFQSPGSLRGDLNMNFETVVFGFIKYEKQAECFKIYFKQIYCLI